MLRTIMGFVLGLGVLAVTAGDGFAQQPSTPAPHAGNTETMAGCMAMMQDAGITEDGRNAMRLFMTSDRAPRAMTGMMEMARRMGNGDVMAGMTRMMEMSGMGGGMMRGHSDDVGASREAR